MQFLTDYAEYLRWCAENLRFPLKAALLGGPTPEEAEEALRAAGWSEARIRKLKERGAPVASQGDAPCPR